MKKLLTLLLIMWAATTHAQLSYGPRAGLNFARLGITNNEYKTSSIIGFYIGGFANYALNERFSLQGELFYSAEGSKEKRVSTSSTGSIRKGYLQLPVLAQYRIIPSLYVEAGPQIGLLLSSKEKFGSSGTTADIKQYYNSTDFRIPVGAGYVFPESVCKGLAVNARYSFSLSRINKITVGGGDLKNHVISIGALYTLPAKKK